MNKQVLTLARELIATPDRWTKGAIARNVHGDPVASRSADAVCWCALGAGLHVAGLILRVPDNALPLDTEARTIESYNDLPSTTHADILAVFDRAISAASE